jgi:hypothetical protein
MGRSGDYETPQDYPGQGDGGRQYGQPEVPPQYQQQPQTPPQWGGQPQYPPPPYQPPGYGPQYPPPQPPQQSRRSRKGPACLGCLGLVVLVGVIAAVAGSHSSSPTAPAAAPSSAAAPAGSQAAQTVQAASPATTAAAAGAVSSAPAPAPASTKPAGTVSELEAQTAAENYLSDGQGFSRQGLIDQLDSSFGNNFSVADATWGVDHSDANWDAQAVDCAKGYMNDGQGFSRQGLIQQMTSAYGNKFTEAQAEYAANAVGL